MAKGLTEILNKVRRPIVKGLVGTMILSSSPRIYSEDSRIIYLSKSHSDNVTAGVIYYKELSQEESEEDRVQRGLDIMSYENKMKIYNENQLSIKMKHKKLKGLLSIRGIIDSIPIAGPILTDQDAEDKIRWWRVYQGEREINDADEFYKILGKMGDDVASEIKKKEKECNSTEHYTSYFSPIQDFKCFFSYEYPNRGLLSLSLPPKEEYSYEFTLKNSGIVIEKYNSELKKKLGLENSDLRKKLGLE